jgi:hypothetical protein
MFIYRISGWLHLSRGTANRFFRWALIELAVLASLFVLALPWGPVGIGMVWGASCWILTIPAVLYAPRPPQLKLASMVEVVWRYTLSSALAGGACAAALHWFPWHIAAPGAAGALARIVVTSSLFSVLYLGAIVLLHGGWTPLREMAGLVRDMLPSQMLPRTPACVTPAVRSA